jgi:hypothetical protein
MAVEQFTISRHHGFDLRIKNFRQGLPLTVAPHFLVQIPIAQDWIRHLEGLPASNALL